MEYFRSEPRAWQVLDAAFGQVFGPRWPKRKPARLLEIGAGHGGLTQFLRPALGEERLTTLDSVALGPASSFDACFDAIASLSTPLPENQLATVLTGWLDALAVEGGVLLFTTLPSTTPDHVGRTLDRLTRGLARWKHMPQCLRDQDLWDQDLWLVTLDPRVHWDAGLDLAVDRPTGHLDSCRMVDGVLHLAGWALGGRCPPRGARVELRVDDQVVAETETSGLRPDALEHLGLAANEVVPIAFELRVEPQRALAASTLLRIDLVDDYPGSSVSNQSRHVLHAGTVEATERYGLGSEGVRPSRWQSLQERLRRLWKSKNASDRVP